MAKIMVAKYPGKCFRCTKPIIKGEPITFYGRGQAAHLNCADVNDHSGIEDREAGDRAYEDMCDRMTRY